MTFNWGLGLCKEFALASGRVVKLKLLGTDRYENDQCQILQGPLDRILGEPYVSQKDVECWKCD